MTHTRGPWTACKTLFNGKTVAFRIACDEHGSSFPLAECAGNQGKYSHDEMEANANLMSTAPDLLEALERMVLICEAYNGIEAKKARTIINKARGNV